jgi:hypothetical protein
MKEIFAYSRLPEVDPWTLSNPSSSATPPSPQFSRPRAQPPPPRPKPPPPPPPAPPLPPAPCPPSWCPSVQRAPALSPLAPVREPVADVFYNVEELAQIANLAARPVSRVRPTTFVRPTPTHLTQTVRPTPTHLT